MRRTALLVTLCGVFNLGVGQTTQTQSPQTPLLQPTNLEAFAKRPTARITWSSQVWSAHSADAQVVITAIVLEDSGEPSQRMKGIRIDLAKQDASDQVFLNETKLAVTRNAVNEISKGLGRLRREDSDIPHRCLGAEEFWHPYPTVHTLDVAYCIAPSWSGLALSAYKGQGFRFPGRSPTELAAAITRAIEELKRR